VNPLVLIGFCLFLVYGVCHTLLKAKLLKPVKSEASSAIIRIIIRCSFRLAILSVVLGFLYAGYKAIKNDAVGPSGSGAITQQVGSCGSNVVGNGNKSTVDCGGKDGKIK
jgi:hypothetical protein